VMVDLVAGLYRAEFLGVEVPQARRLLAMNCPTAIVGNAVMGSWQGATEADLSALVGTAEKPRAVVLGLKRSVRCQVSIGRAPICCPRHLYAGS
jgi:hypothetical protein